MLLATFLTGLLNTVILLVGIVLIFLVLIQRGRGGGLIGALGGAGGSSPFGSRAGDMFTRITIVVALVWIVLAMIQIKVLQPDEQPQRPPAAEAPNV